MQVDLNRSTRKRPHSTRCTIPDRLSYLCRRKSNESFTCAGSFSPDLVSHSRFQSISYDDLLQKSQTQKYHYQKHLDIVAQKAQPLQSTPHRCSFLFHLRTDKGDPADFSMQTVDMVYNVRWLRLISEVEKAVNTRPFRPIRPPPRPDRKAVLRDEKGSTPLDSHIPFPIPPTQAFPIKDKTSTDARGIRATGNPQRDALDDHRLKFRGRLPSRYYDSTNGRTDLFESGFNFRQSQELQMERWDHLVQLERRAREASEEGLRKASLGSTTSLNSNVPPFPPRKLSSGILNRIRRPSTAIKDSKSTLSISHPIVISPLESSFLLGTNLAPDFESGRPDLYHYQIQGVRSFSKPDLSSHPALEMPDLSLERVDEDDEAQEADADHVGSEIPKQQESSFSLPFSRHDLPRPKGPRPPRSSIRGSNFSSADTVRTPRGSISHHESTDEPTTSDLATHEIVYPDVPPLRITKRSLKRRDDTPAAKNCDLMPEQPVVSHKKFTSDEIALRYNHHGGNDVDPERTTSTSDLIKLISKDQNGAQIRSGTTGLDIPVALPSDHSENLDSKRSFAAIAELEPNDPPISMQLDAKREIIGLFQSKSTNQDGLSVNHPGDQNQIKRPTEVNKLQKLPELESSGSSQLQLYDVTIEDASYLSKRTSKSIKGETLEFNQRFTNQESPLSDLNGSRSNIDPQRRSFPDQYKLNQNLKKKIPHNGQASGGYTVPLDTKNEAQKTLNQVSPRIIPPNQYHRSLKRNLGHKRALYKRTPFNQSITKPVQSSEKSSESLIFELPIKPEKNLSTQINDQKVKQAWESVSHYKKWTGMNRPNTQGVVRIQGGRLRNDNFENVI